MSAILLPQFAVGSSAPDLPELVNLQPPPTLSLPEWLPKNPTQLAVPNAYFGAVQDNSIRFATNGIYVVSCGGYLQNNSDINNTMKIIPGTNYSFGLLETSIAGIASAKTYISGMIDWTGTFNGKTGNPQLITPKG